MNFFLWWFLNHFFCLFAFTTWQSIFGFNIRRRIHANHLVWISGWMYTRIQTEKSQELNVIKIKFSLGSHFGLPKFVDLNELYFIFCSVHAMVSIHSMHFRKCFLIMINDKLNIRLFKIESVSWTHTHTHLYIYHGIKYIRCRSSFSIHMHAFIVHRF